MARRKLFCEYGPVCYRLSLWKERLRKTLRDRRAGLCLARRRTAASLPALAKGHRSLVLRRLTGVDMALQKNKQVNLALAAGRIDGVVVEPGETIALVGPTGAGKTTIVNLISRFYDIEDGVISVDGYDLTKISIESLRRQMGVMTQDNFIFHGTVRENILYGKLDATDEEMIAAAKAVNAHEFIMKMEKGYDTELKEHGAGLSIGQRQLIAFARTMISMPKILILDEATSSIDTHTEILVQKGIEALLSGRTSFVIAHRLSTIQNADRIFVIDQGGILEQGSPAELMKKKGAYYDLYMAQFAGLE